VKVNLGCGLAYMQGWVNVDASPDVKADIYLDAAEFVRQYGAEVEQVYLGHVLEHLMPGDALTLLQLLNERLPTGALVSAVTPDMAQIFDRYLAGEIDNDDLNSRYVYSYEQPSHHQWCYDEAALTAVFRRAGFRVVEPIDPLSWEPVYWKAGPESRWQSGVRSHAAGTEPAEPLPTPAVAALSVEETERLGGGPVTAAELLEGRVRRLREQLQQASASRELLERRVAELERLIASDAPQRPACGPPPAAVGRRRERPERATGVLSPFKSPWHSADEEARVRRAARAARESRRAPRRAAVEAARELLPKGTREREVARAAYTTYREVRELGRRVRHAWKLPGLMQQQEPPYDVWRRWHDASPAVLKAQSELAERVGDWARVLVLILVTADGDVRASVDSVHRQSWPRVQIRLCYSRDVDPPVLPPHPRARLTSASTGTLVDALNEAVLAADDDFVVLLNAGDQLAPDCCYEIAAAAHEDPFVDLVSWDDDRLLGGERLYPRFRPSWSPDSLLGANYLGQSFAIRRSRYLFAGGLRDGYGEAMVWDLLLRAGLTAERTTRRTRILGHVGRCCEGVGPDGVRAVQDHLSRSGVAGTASLGGQSVRVRWEREQWPDASIIIPTKHNRAFLATVLSSIAESDYPSYEVIVVDNGARTTENESWYAETFSTLPLTVRWWTKPFNYSRVNNVAAASAHGQLLVFLNDDTEVLDPGWLKELAGWAMQPEIGLVGGHLTGPDGHLQHAGVVIGMGGFADHVFEGMAPETDSLLGPTAWYRNWLSVTAACVAVRRSVFEEVGGFDERFLLCGSDVALGLDAKLHGLRNVCSPYVHVRHLESATRGSHVPSEDFFTSYWRYNPYLFGGDPYYNPNLTLSSRRPELRPASEPSPEHRLEPILGRSFRAFRQTNEDAEARLLATLCRSRPVDDAAVGALHAAAAEPFAVSSVNWYIPDIDSPFYGGINTAFRIADHLARHCGVVNRFIVWSRGPEQFIRSALAAAFPALGDCEIMLHEGSPAQLAQAPIADVSIATLWLTAYAVQQAENTRRKFYLVQDFEPLFYPASTLYALTEESYRLGLYALCNTDNLARVYRDGYGGKGFAFMPAVDPAVFHARGRVGRHPEDPVTVFVYARPGHWRNCWEMASLALQELKGRLGDRVRIVTAGAWAVPGGDAAGMKHLGLLDYRETGNLYRSCDVGLALTVSKHPSYLPLELMACGVPVVAFDNPWGHWILRDGENALLAKRTVDHLVDQLDRLCTDYELRRRLREQALSDIAAGHASWERALEPVYGYLCDPEGAAAAPLRGVAPAELSVEPGT